MATKTVEQWIKFQFCRFTLFIAQCITSISNTWIIQQMLLYIINVFFCLIWISNALFYFILYKIYFRFFFFRGRFECERLTERSFLRWEFIGRFSLCCQTLFSCIASNTIYSINFILSILFVLNTKINHGMAWHDNNMGSFLFLLHANKTFSYAWILSGSTE